jgi:uncharacterized membrane protein YoaK (UPF0700 family)
MALESTSPELTAKARVSARAPEQSLAVACLLTVSGGFLDAISWPSLGGVFTNSQTGNVVSLGMGATLGKWNEATHHIPPVLAFLAGALVAIRFMAPLLCLTGEIVSLIIVMLLTGTHRQSRVQSSEFLLGRTANRQLQPSRALEIPFCRSDQKHGSRG